MRKRLITIDDFNNLDGDDKVYVEDSLEGGYQEVDQQTIGMLLRYGIVNPDDLVLYADLTTNWDVGESISYDDLLDEEENSLFVYEGDHGIYEVAPQWKIDLLIRENKIAMSDVYRLVFHDNL